MKYVALLLLAIVLSACDTSEEDRFFYDGWLHPERASNQRLYGGEVPQSKPDLPPP